MLLLFIIQLTVFADKFGDVRVSDDIYLCGEIHLGHPSPHLHQAQDLSLQILLSLPRPPRHHPLHPLQSPHILSSQDKVSPSCARGSVYSEQELQHHISGRLYRVYIDTVQSSALSVLKSSVNPL